MFARALRVLALLAALSRNGFLTVRMGSGSGVGVSDSRTVLLQVGSRSLKICQSGFHLQWSTGFQSPASRSKIAKGSALSDTSRAEIRLLRPQGPHIETQEVEEG